MEEQAAQYRHLVHQVNNLLAVIQTQVAVAEAVATPEATQGALDQIGKSAERLAEELRVAREPGGQAQ